jgi:hypothetical protein
MGHEVPDRGHEGVGVEDLHGINAAGIAIHQVSAGERQLAVNRLPSRLPQIACQDAAVIEKVALGRAVQAAHAADAVGHVRRGGIVGFVAGISGRPGEFRVLDQHVGRIDITAVVPDMGDDDAAVRAGEIDSHAARGVVGGVQALIDGDAGQLPRGRIGAFARCHGQDLLAHDHEAVVEHAHHHHEEDGQDERELDERLALASPASDAQALDEG